MPTAQRALRGSPYINTLAVAFPQPFQLMIAIIRSCPRPFAGETKRLAVQHQVQTKSAKE